MGADSITAIWNILKGSLRVESGAPVDVLASGTTADQVLQGQLRSLNTTTKCWAYLARTLRLLRLRQVGFTTAHPSRVFRVSCTDGLVSMGSTVDIPVQAGPSHFDGSGVAHLPYQIVVQFNNVTGGSRQTTISAEAPDSTSRTSFSLAVLGDP